MYSFFLIFGSGLRHLFLFLFGSFGSGLRFLILFLFGRLDNRRVFESGDHFSLRGKKFATFGISIMNHRTLRNLFSLDSRGLFAAHFWDLNFFRIITLIAFSASSLPLAARTFIVPLAHNFRKIVIEESTQYVIFKKVFEDFFGQHVAKTRKEVVFSLDIDTALLEDGLGLFSHLNNRNDPFKSLFVSFILLL
jgi:hypothetical protein